MCSKLNHPTDAFQFNYRIQAARKIAACSGVFGTRVKIDATYNVFVNDQGCANTNKACDLKVHLLGCLVSSV